MMKPVRALPSSLSLSLTRDFRPSSHGSSSTIRPVNSSRRRGTRYNVSRIPGCWCSPFLTCPADGPHGNQCARPIQFPRVNIVVKTRDRRFNWHLNSTTSPKIESGGEVTARALWSCLESIFFPNGRWQPSLLAELREGWRRGWFSKRIAVEEELKEVRFF